jgi:hypothetical protein
MHPLVGKRSVVFVILNYVSDQLIAETPSIRQAIGTALQTSDAATIEQKRAAMATQLSRGREAMAQESDHHDLHYVSRIDVVGLFQSILTKVFADIPDLQGYGDLNPSWVTTTAEEIEYGFSRFVNRVWEDVHGGHKFLIASIITELVHFRNDRFPYPSGTPITGTLPENTGIALLGDWGGDNDAAKKVATWVRNQKSTHGIHLGDIYYGGAKEECVSFLRLWPFHIDLNDSNSAIREGSSFALNGNHEMYSGGEYYFNIVLPAFRQSMPFFCLENQHWRMIGLDTAYGGGRLKPAGPGDPLAAQWNWLIDLLKNGQKRANILLTHHQPVSAHRQEYEDSAVLRSDILELLSMEGIGNNAIFGWFFGHEHRCVVYRDSKLPYNARLIGNGCIPHLVQNENEADSGCTPFAYVNRRETAPGSNTAVSSFVNLWFAENQMAAEYVDEDGIPWGTEIWNADDRQSPIIAFTEHDGTA